MDPPLDPPLVAAQPTGPVPAVAAAAAAAAAANATPAQPVAHNHPPYAEMITAAITALKERDGSSKRAIAKYIETHYSDLPPTHSALLTHHLKRLKTHGQLHMVKKSYKLPTRSTAAAVNGAVNAVSSDPASAGTKRRPGRPPKPKPDAIQAAVPVFAAPINMNAEPVVVPEAPPPQNVAGGPVNGVAAGGPVRGRGRPPKRGPGRPPKIGGGVVPSGGSVGRGRGRPRRNAAVAPAAAREKGPGRPRGRPPKPINVVGGLAPVAPLGGGFPAVPVAVGVANVGAPPVAGKRRGRPPKAGGVAKKLRAMNTLQPKKPRKLSGKPLGRPRKANRGPESQLLVAYLDLKGKLESLKSTIEETAKLIRPSLNSEAAMNALQELVQAGENAIAPPNAQNPQPPPEQPQPQT